MNQESPVAATYQSRYAGRARDLFPLYLKTLALTLVTFGIYRFWARARVREHIWSRIVVLDDRLEYTGTGAELFMGFLKAVLALMPVLVAMQVADVLAVAIPDWALAFIGVKTALYLALGYLFFVGYYASLRYRLSRTRWRGVRFAQLGSPWIYGRMALLGTALRAVTAGLYTPYYDVKLARYETGHRRFGTGAFAFSGKGGDLFGYFFVCWLLLLPTLGLSWFWYDARRMRYIAAGTRMGGLDFMLSPSATGWKVLRLKLGNVLLSLLTLGLCYPVVVRRTLRFWCDNLSAAGAVDFDRIRQAAALPGSGEGLAGFFNVDAMGG
ncbi:MAG: DUF898 family protein [Rhodospirillales bacterium]